MFNPPWTSDLTPKPLPASSTTDSMSRRRESGGRNGHVEMQSPNSRGSGPYHYYQAPSRTSTEDQRRSYSERVGDPDSPAYDGVLRSDSKAAPEHMPDVGAKPSVGAPGEAIQTSFVHGGTTSEQLAQSQHVNSTDMPGSSHQEPFVFGSDDVPNNIRSKPWSPEPTAARPDQDPQGLQSLPAESDTSGAVRRGSVPHQSPLQKLEGHLDSISKEEKRARVEDAENSVRRKSLSGQGRPTTSTAGDPQRAATLRHERGRVISDGSKRPTESASDRDYQDLPQQASAGASLEDNAGDSKLRRAATAPTSRQRQELAIAQQARPYHHASTGSRDLSARDEPRPYHHAPPVPRDLGSAQRPASLINPPRTTDATPQRFSSAGHDRRARKPVTSGPSTVATDKGLSAADRGRVAHERRKAREQEALRAAAPDTITGATAMDRNSNTRAQARSSHQESPNTGLNGDALRPQKQSLDAGPRPENGNRLAGSGPNTIPTQKTPAQPSSRNGSHGAAEAAAGAVLATGGVATALHHDKERRFGRLFHHHDDDHHQSNVKSEPLDEWRHAQVARLDVADTQLDINATRTSDATNSDPAWWEKNKVDRRASGSTSRQTAAPTKASAQFDGTYEERASMFNPPLFLKCGPLLRYTGIRREQSGGSERATWRGSVMIVTDDAQSELATVPVLRLFAQPMDLVQPPQHFSSDQDLDQPRGVYDPVAGQIKISRTGRPLYVRPVQEIQGAVDLSREENNRGLYAANRSPLVASNGANLDSQENTRARTAQENASRISTGDGEKLGRYKDVKAIRLHQVRGFTFWRFSLEIELASIEHRIAYRINNGPALGFWVPSRSQSMNIMFHSCNGFSLGINSHEFSGPDPLWRDVLNKHQSQPFHVMIGGGDQLYMDAAVRDTQLFGNWIRMKNPEHKHKAPFTPEMQDELDNFYLHRYAMWFSQGLFAMAASQIPMVNLWDDHDIIDGFGSYPHRLMAAGVFTGLGAVAFKYYMLFQHQSVSAETSVEEESWVLGASPGPYINELSRSVFLDMGQHVKFLGIDCRTERTRDEIVSQETYDILFDRCEQELVRGETKHLIVLLGVPIAYPRLNFLENVLTSRVMDPVKAVGRIGLLGGFVNKFDGGVEILDDLDDHWTAKHHKGERNWLIQELQSFAAEKSVRITILGGDVHLGAIGQFYTPRKLGIAKDKDHRYMPNVISSAIVNTPPPTVMADILNRRNKVHHLDAGTDEDLIPMFDYDVNGNKRNNKCLLPRRNYCTIREFMPGSTPPSTPRNEASIAVPGTPNSQSETPGEGLWAARVREERDRRYPPGSMRRTMSLTRTGANKLVRRMSNSSKSGVPRGSSSDSERGVAAHGLARSQSQSAATPNTGGDGGDFPPADFAPRRPSFHRRPTNFSEKEVRRAAQKGGAPTEDEQGNESSPRTGHVNLEGGLDISLNMEINQRDPSGQTQAYRLLVPALFYDSAPGTMNTRFKAQRPSLMQRLTSVRRRKEIEDNQREDDRSLSPPFQQQQQQQYTGTGLANPVHPNAGYSTRDYSDTDGANDQHDSVALPSTQRSSMIPRQENTTSSYDKGYNLSGPPIGAGHDRRVEGDITAGARDDRTYPSALRSQPQQQQQQPRVVDTHRGQNGSANGYNDYADGSPAQSDLGSPMEQEEEFTPPPSRRVSKMARFYGVGDDDEDIPPRSPADGPGPSAQEPKKRRFSWRGFR